MTAALEQFAQPTPVTDVEIVFPAHVGKLLPPYDDLPEEFIRGFSPYCDVVHTWFYSGLRKDVLKPKSGIDGNAAFRHVKACLGSFEPKHEHKFAGVAYLLSRWFDIAEEKDAVPSAP